MMEMVLVEILNQHGETLTSTYLPCEEEGGGLLVFRDVVFPPFSGRGVATHLRALGVTVPLPTSSPPKRGLEKV